MKFGEIERGRFRFIATNTCSNMVKYGELYESDELGNIELENGNVLCTCGDRANFLKQAELFIGVNDFIELSDEQDERKIKYALEMVSTLHPGDLVEWGGNNVLYRFIRFVRNEAVVQHVDFENLYQTVSVQWLRPIKAENNGEAEAV